MSQAHPHDTRERRRYRRRSTATPADRARDGGLTVFLWLFALLIAEAALFLWLLERGYQQ
jgi:hypothetical protein